MSLFPPGKVATMINALHDPDCGRFLSMCPKSEFFTFTNQQMEVVLRFRLALPQSGFIEGKICLCQSRVDAEAVHAFTGCFYGGYGGGRIATHNFIRDMIAFILRYCGYRPRIEARYAEHHMRRGDITVTLTGSNKQSIIDISQTSSYPANGGSLTEAELKDVDHTKKVLQKRFDSKIAHHVLGEANNLELIPCAIDCSGQMHECFKNFTKKVLKTAAEQKNIPFGVVWNYWCSAIVSALFKGNANSVASLSRKLYGTVSPDSFESTDMIVSRSSYG
jgi:hypothetical protein